MPTTTINGREVFVDDEGFMTEYDQWDETMGAALATPIGVDMTDDGKVRVLGGEHPRQIRQTTTASIPTCKTRAMVATSVSSSPIGNPIPPSSSG